MSDWVGYSDFGLLLRDLRALVGAESLLVVADDRDVIRFLLALVGQRAETSAALARVILARMELQEAEEQEAEEGGET